MPEVDEDRNYSEAVQNAWQATIDDMEGMAAQLDEKGWTTIAIAADDTIPTSPNAGETDQYGFDYVIPDNLASAFSETFNQGHEEGGGFDEYEVYRSEADGRVFQVTVFYDELTANTILLAGTYELMNAEDLMRTTIERNEIYTHVQAPDGTDLGSFRHEGWEHFFPNAKQRLGT
jgi:hypothetical protein